MFKNIFLLSLIFLNILIISSGKSTEEDFEQAAEDYKNNYINEFKEKVKKYLSDRHLYKNDSALISKEEFRTIFRDIMSDGDEGKVSEGFSDTFNSLTDEFVEDAFPGEINYIKGSKIHEFFDYENIMDKFNKYAAKMYQKYGNENLNKDNL